MTLQQTPEKRAKAIDVNLLPPEYLPAKKSKLSLILYITIVILVCALVPLFIVKSVTDSDNKSLQGQVNNLQQQLVTLQANKNQANAINSQIADAQHLLATVQADYQTFASSRYSWSQIINEINSLIPGKKLTLNSITTSDANIVTLTGTSTKRNNVLDYVQSLNNASDFFTNVDFGFGDCPNTGACTFSITAPLANMSVSNVSQ